MVQAFPRACRLRRHRLTPSHLPARTSPRIARPLFDSAERDEVQPAAELGHLQGHDHGQHVQRALRACPDPQALSRAFPRACPLAPPLPQDVPPASQPAPSSPSIVRAPLSTLGRTQTPCPPPTSCSSAARGRAPPPSPPLDTARTSGICPSGLVPGGLSRDRDKRDKRDHVTLRTKTMYRTSTIRCPYYGEERGPALPLSLYVPPCKSLIAANKRDCLPDRLLLQGHLRTTSISDLDSLVAAGKRDCLCCP
jgi:hypothetical protein